MIILHATPPSGAASNIATATRHVLANGIVALIQRNPTSPTVSVRGEVRVGAVNEPVEQSGLAVFTGAALIRGAGKRSFQQIVAETEERGCSVNAGGGLHSSGFGGKALAEDLPLVLEIVADMLIRPTFPAHEVEKLRGQFLTGLRESEQETQTQASRAVRSLLYPANHPYSRLSSGSVETVQQISRDDLVAFHQYYHPALSIIAIVGDVEPEAVVAELERVFGGWELNRPPLAQNLPAVPPIKGIHRRDVAMSGKTQSDIIWGVHGLKRSAPDYYAAMIGNMILGRIGLGGRLGANIRERQGMAYYIYSGLEADFDAGPWAAIAGVNPANVERTITAILEEIEQFKQEGPTPEELSDAQAYITGSLVLGLETNDGIAGTLLAIERHNLGLDYITRYADIINAVSCEDVTTVVRAYLSTENYVLVVAGSPA